MCRINFDMDGTIAKSFMLPEVKIRSATEANIVVTVVIIERNNVSEIEAFNISLNFFV